MEADDESDILTGVWRRRIDVADGNIRGHEWYKGKAKYGEVTFGAA